MKCKNCGAKLKVNPLNEEAYCEYCKSTFKIDDEVLHIQYDNIEQAGYEFEKGRIKAQQESKRQKQSINNYYTEIHYEQKKPKKSYKKLWLILIGIALLPFTATYFIIKTNKLDKKKKIIIIVVMWTVFLIIGCTSSAQEKEEKKKRIVDCYSEEVYNKLDELIGIDNINGNFKDTYTCEKLSLKDKNYKAIEISLDDNKELITIKIEDETLFNNNSN